MAKHRSEEVAIPFVESTVTQGSPQNGPQGVPVSQTDEIPSLSAPAPPRVILRGVAADIRCLAKIASLLDELTEEEQDWVVESLSKRYRLKEPK